jgi:hypothetical protein
MERTSRCVQTATSQARKSFLNPVPKCTQRFKDSITFPAVARSVCSDIDGGRDNGSVDGRASVIGEVLVYLFSVIELLLIPCACTSLLFADMGRKKIPAGALSQLFAWANSATLPKTPTPSQPSTPRRVGRPTNESGVSSSDVVQMLEAFSGNGMHF